MNGELQTGHYAEAESLGSSLLELAKRQEAQPSTARAGVQAQAEVERLLAKAYQRQERFPEAERMARESYRHALGKLGPDDAMTMESCETLVDILRQGK